MIHATSMLAKTPFLEMGLYNALMNSHVGMVKNEMGNSRICLIDKKGVFPFYFNIF